MFSPASRAWTIACERSTTCSLLKMFETWLRTVFWLSLNRRANRCVVLPLGDQLEHLTLAARQLGEGLRRPVERRREVLDESLRDRRPKTASPAPTALIACRIST
jgi:hypothetical protein